MKRYSMAVHIDDEESFMLVEVNAASYNLAVEFLQRLFKDVPDVWFVGEEIE